MSLKIKKIERFKKYLELSAAGENDIQIAGIMGVHRKTIYNWKKEIKNTYKIEEAHHDLVMKVIKQLYSLQQYNFDQIVGSLLEENKEADLATMYELSANVTNYAIPVANLIKKLGIGKCQALLDEVERLEERIKVLEQLLLKFHANNDALEHEESQPYPEAKEQFANL